MWKITAKILWGVEANRNITEEAHVTRCRHSAHAATCCVGRGRQRERESETVACVGASVEREYKVETTGDAS